MLFQLREGQGRTERERQTPGQTAVAAGMPEGTGQAAHGVGMAARAGLQVGKGLC